MQHNKIDSANANSALYFAGPRSLYMVMVWQSVRARADRARHPNWGHPDRDACGTGFVARLGGVASHDIINYALTALERLTHRGGVDADGASGDGAGLLTSLPHSFFRARALEQGIDLPEIFGLVFAFFPKAAEGANRAHLATEPARGRGAIHPIV